MKYREALRRHGLRLSLIFSFLMLSACVGAVVGAAVDTTIEVAKVPFKVGGAAIDLVVPDDEDD